MPHRAAISGPGTARLCLEGRLFVTRVKASDGTDPSNRYSASTSKTSRPDQHETAAWHRSAQSATRKAATGTKASNGKTPNEKTTYTVREGDTLGELSTRYGVPVADLRAANPGVKDPNEISVGQKLTIPLASANAQLPGAYTVHSGDTLNRIAVRHHSSAPLLAAADNIANPDSIHTGEQISIPGAGGR